METVQKRGPCQWRVQIRKKGHPPQPRTFDVRSESDAWDRQVEGEMDRGLFVSWKEAENMTLSEALDRYEREILSKKHSSDQDRIYVSGTGKNGSGRAVSCLDPGEGSGVLSGRKASRGEACDGRPGVADHFPSLYDYRHGMEDGGARQSGRPDLKAQTAARKGSKRSFSLLRKGRDLFPGRRQ